MSPSNEPQQAATSNYILNALVAKGTYALSAGYVVDLLTLEPSISESQPNEIQGYGLQLVLPRSIHASYDPAQQDWLMDVSDFIRLAILIPT